MNLFKKIPGIYKITNILNNDCYLGSAKNLYKREIVHLSLLRNNKHPNIHLQRAWNRYGEENFIFEVILYCDLENRKIYEQLCLDKFIPKYNIATSANGGSGTVTKKMIEACRKTGIAQKGKEKPQSYKDKLSERMLGNTIMLGKSHSKESKEKMSKALIGNTRWLGKQHTPETKEKMRNASKGRTFSDETRRKMSESRKAYFARIRAEKVVESGV